MGWRDGLVDEDLGLPVAEALTVHRAHVVDLAPLVANLVLPDTDLADLARFDGEPVDLTLSVRGGAGAIEPAVTWAGRAPVVRLRAVHVTLRDEADLARNAARVVAMVDHVRSQGLLDDEVEVRVEPPSARDVGEHAWLAALDEIAMADLRPAFRFTDDADEIRVSIDAALDREAPFSALGGPAPDRLLAATRACLDGTDVAAALAGELPDDEVLAATRRWFTRSVVTDPVRLA